MARSPRIPPRVGATPSRRRRGRRARRVALAFALGLPLAVPLLAVSLGAAECPGKAKDGQPAGDIMPPAQLASFVEQAVDDGWCIGLAVGLVDGERVQIAGFGRLAADDGRVPDGDTVFEIGSVSKVFTSLLLAEAVARGALQLDDPVAAVLAAEPGRPPRRELLAEPDDGRVHVTLLDLATHASGLPRMPDNFEPADPSDPYADYDRAALAEFLAGRELTRRPRTGYEYSNLGVGLLGDALAHRAGTGYGELLVERVCLPLGLRDTRVELDERLAGRLAPPHDVDGRPSSSWHLGALAGAGGIRSTVSDMTRFAQAQMLVGEPALAPALKQMLPPRAPASSPTLRMALGWHIDLERGVWRHSGQTGGYHAYVGLAPDREQAVVVLANTANMVVDTIGSALLDHLGGEGLEPLELPRLRRLEPEQLDRCVGRYQLSPGYVLAIERKGEVLEAQLPHQDAWRVFPRTDREFLYRVVEARLLFDGDGDGGDGGDGAGPMERVTLFQNGRELVFERVADDGAGLAEPDRATWSPAADDGGR